MKAVLAALLLLCGAGLSACGDTTTSVYCSLNSDCTDEQPFCRNGLCHANECNEAQDCPDGESCSDNRCQ